jgi:NAD(P)H-hydrate epimerase
MERASLACVTWFKTQFDTSRKIKVFVGPGNNGGDGLAISRMLASDGYTVSVYLLFAAGKLSPDALENYNRLVLIENVDISQISEARFPMLTEGEILIDAMLAQAFRDGSKD